MHPDQEAVFSEIEKVVENYDLGELVYLERNERGYNNINFAIQTIKHGIRQDYFLRRYKPSIHPDEIIFEHAVINHLLEQHFNLVARVHETRDGSTFFFRPAGGEFTQPAFYAIFDFLEGEDRYTWIDPHISPDEVSSSASVLAQFHNAISNFIPQGCRIEPKILELLPQITAYLESSLQNSKGTSFDALLQNNLAFLLDCCSEMQAYCTDLQLSDAPQLVIHCDFHPGNLKFRDQEVVGLFDFDWSKIDLRCFDVALAIWYYTNWRGNLNGILRLEQSKQFLKTYQGTLQNLTALEPMTEFEIEQLPVMINLSNLYILYWTVTDYFSNPVDADEYFVYLQHSINFSRWFAGKGRTLIRESLSSAK